MSPTQLHAVDLEYCGEGVECDCSQFEEYDQCAEIDMQELVDTGDPYAVRDAYNIETVWNSEDASWHVSANVTTPESRILPVHPNRGHWESMEELNNYVYTALAIEGGAQLGDFCVDRHDIAFRGFYGRWDTKEGEWAPRQNGGFIFDMISGPNGELLVDGVDMSREFDNVQQAEYTSPGGHLKARQRSQISRDITEGNSQCRTNDGEADPIPNAETIIDHVGWYNNAGKLADGISFRWELDVLHMKARYYDGYGTLRDTQSTNPILQYSYAKIEREHPGTCGYGWVEKNNERIEEMTTRAGSAPSACPAPPS